MDGLLARIPARLFAEWQAYYRLEPFGQERANLHTAQIAKMVYDVAVKPADRDKVKLNDLMLNAPAEAPQPKTAKELYGLFRMTALSLGAQDPQADNDEE